MGQKVKNVTFDFQKVKKKKRIISGAIQTDPLNLQKTRVVPICEVTVVMHC